MYRHHGRVCKANAMKPRDLLFALGLCLVGIWGAYHAWLYRFLCDDAYISFRYVENALLGHGLVFNPGERVEGYTNFLWVLELIALRGLTGLAIEPLAFGLSSLYTVGYFAVAALIAIRTPLAVDKRWVCVLTLAGLAMNRSVAVWSTSGLETRQFSFFIMLAVCFLATGDPNVRRAIFASLAMAMAALTRPDTLLLWGCAGLWIITVHWCNPKLLICLALAWGIPFCAIVGTHFLWRHSFYGEWLPNTYYAKVIGDWWEGGYLFFTVAALENVLYLFIPLAAIAAWYRGRYHGDRLYRLFLLLVLPHAIYWARAGGDHFEYRIIDFWWPILTLGVVEGALILGKQMGEGATPRWRRAVPIALLSVFALYLYSFQSLKTRPTPETKPRTMPSFIGEDASAHVELLPGGSYLMYRYHRASVECIKHFIAIPHLRHRELWLHQREGYAPYTATWEDHPLPKGLTMAQDMVGVVPYYLRDVEVIDVLGLTDAHVARMPIDIAAEDRALAHDRMATDAYLRERGCNINIERASTSRDEALLEGLFAAKLAPNLWMPFDIRFDTVGYDWVRETFAGYEVWTRGPNGVPHQWVDPADSF